MAIQQRIEDLGSFSDPSAGLWAPTMWGAESQEQYVVPSLSRSDRYVTVDEQVENTVGLVVATWPTADDFGLRFPDETDAAWFDAGDLQSAIDRLRREADELVRSLRIGDCPGPLSRPTFPSWPRRILRRRRQSRRPPAIRICCQSTCSRCRITHRSAASIWSSSNGYGPPSTLVSSTPSGVKYGFPHTVSQEAIREALDPVAGKTNSVTGMSNAHKADAELGLLYTSDITTAPGSPNAGSVALVLRGRRRQLWRFGDAPTEAVDLAQGRCRT